MQAYVLMLQADDDDKYLTESVLADMQQSIPMRFIPGIDELNDVLNSEGLPSVILINNQDHRHKAIEIVKHIKTNPAMNHIPVVVLGEITTAEYIRQYYRAGANSYITKPSTMDGMRKKIRSFLEYWFEVAEIQSQ